MIDTCHISAAINRRFFDAPLSVGMKKGMNEPNKLEDITNDTWARLDIPDLYGEWAGNGDGPIIKVSGIIVVDVFSPVNSGTGDAEKIGDELGDLFGLKSFECIRTSVPSFRYYGVTASGWAHHKFMVEFDYYKTVTDGE